MSINCAGIITEPESPIPTDDLRLFYPLTPDTVQNGYAIDQSDTGLDIQNHGATMTQSGASFDGTDDRFGPLNIGPHSDAVTLSFWLDNIGPITYSPVGMSDDLVGNSFLIYDGDVIYIGDDAIHFTDKSATTDTHVLLKYDTGNWELKFDDAPHASGTVGGSFTGDWYFLLGADANGPQGGDLGGYYDGHMHDVALYSRETTDAEDTQLYNNPSI